MMNEYEVLSRAWKWTLDRWTYENDMYEKYHDDIAKERRDRHDREMQELAIRMKEIELEEKGWA